MKKRILSLLLALVRWLYGKVQNDAKKLRLFKGALACAVVLAVVGGVLALSRMGGGLAPDQLLMTNPNGDSIWTFSLGYICRNLPATAKLLLRTIPEQGALWLQGVLGTTLGEPIVYRLDVSWLLGVGLVLALLSAAICFVNFYFGRFIGGRRYRREASQVLGQKNTTLTIFLALTYANPLVALGPTFYVIWHNAWNACQLQMRAVREKRKRLRAELLLRPHGGRH